MTIPSTPSKDEVVACSREAAYWIDGYLRGAEPAASRMFGDEIWEVDEDDPRWESWRCAVDQFRDTGVWELEWDHDYEEPEASDVT